MLYEWENIRRWVAEAVDRGHIAVDSLETGLVSIDIFVCGCHLIHDDENRMAVSL
jgi:hypothetical protein